MNASEKSNDLNNLFELEKKELINLIITINKTNLDNLSEEIKAISFKKEIICPYCKSDNFKLNGKYRERQRYYCKCCLTTFNDCTGSLLAGAHYPNKFLRNIEYMIKGYSLSMIAKQLDIHFSTAFHWRHKVLDILRPQGFEKLTGIVETAQITFPKSKKGNNHLLSRKPQKKTLFQKNKSSQEEVTVMLAVDSNQSVVSGIFVGSEQYDMFKFEEVIGKYITPSCTLCIDENSMFFFYAEVSKIKYKKVNKVRTI